MFKLKKSSFEDYFLQKLQNSKRMKNNKECFVSQFP